MAVDLFAAGVAELVDARGLKPLGLRPVPVRVRPPAPRYSIGGLCESEYNRDGQSSSATHKVTLSELTAIDLFSGCGGLSLGLKRAGFRVLAAVDSDPLSMSTYRANHKGCHYETADIRDVDPLALMDKVGLAAGELDLLAGCPPCQGFSTLRTLNGRRSVNEPMNDLIFEFLPFIEVFKPRCLMIENVPGLLSDERLVNFSAELEELDYRVRADVFDASEFGVPQRRRRMILIAGKARRFDFSKPAKRKRTVRGSIGGLPPPGEGNDPAHDYKVSRARKVTRLIKKIPEDGGSRSQLPKRNQLPCHKRVAGFYDIYGRMSWSGPSPTITSGCINPSKGRFLHPEQHRAITVREAAILQGFPRNYHIEMSRGRYPAAQMIGNAFPPRFAEVHARGLRDQLAETI